MSRGGARARSPRLRHHRVGESFPCRRKFPARRTVTPVRLLNSHFFPRDEYFMRLALREAARALEHDDVPIGAIVVKDGELIGSGHNEREIRSDPTAHAEVIALREAARTLGSWRVLDSVMYVTLEPCAMCAGAIVLSRLPRVVFGAADPKAGAAGSVLERPRCPAGSTTAPRWWAACWPRTRPTCCGRSSPRAAASGAIRGLSSILVEVAWRGGRAVECAGLENRYGLSVHRGFESPPLRCPPRVFRGSFFPPSHRARFPPHRLSSSRPRASARVSAVARSTSVR